MSDFKNSNWVPSEEDNLGAISESYYSIKKQLEILQDKVNCPDNFIYDFLEKIIGQTCCSDTDFEKNFYYDITEENKQLKFNNE